ncbi:hypothetical protein X743_05140 [Mesorhizobium sp. LNHC252B00]|nr:hypothetical protein X743_05140 [Mesorhizobium sp. LNHC252B00]
MDVREREPDLSRRGSKSVATFCSSMIFSQNRLALFAIML